MHSEYRVKYNIPKFKRIGIMDHDRASCLVSLHNFPCYLLQDEWIQRDLKTINLITRTIQYDGLTQFQICVFSTNKQNKRQIINKIWTCFNVSNPQWPYVKRRCSFIFRLILGIYCNLNFVYLKCHGNDLRIYIQSH